ncbi:glycogen debranching protein GlgX [Sphingomonas carotinifaciens]|uniref:glycogen debranching protein GlgX n=1 Tax=Sphingomonas carotinifaciens TaxID=1166323 RepID=UPI000DDB97C9|nr:glycogen debranching protein GlgX [Sphingomonas carotinifaciens]
MQHTFHLHSTAEQIDLCLFTGTQETRHPLTRTGENAWSLTLDLPQGQRYAYRAHGPYDPANNQWFDPAKLLVDPHARELDAPFTYSPRLSTYGEDTADIVPRAILTPPLTAPPPPRLFQPGGLIYELNVRGFTMRHPDVPPEQRGTLAALVHPAVIAHLQKLGVAAVELMPITAWIDERHLSALGLTNAWGYNPVVPMALDPRLVPGGVAELVATVAALRDAGIGTILDLVFNHTGESDIHGPTLSFRGYDPQAYATTADGTLINDTGTGNTLATGRPHIRALILDTLRHFARAGVDGFRFDLAPILARDPGFDPQAPLFTDLAADPHLASRLMIAEPWDIGPGGYQLGQFPDTWLEWNDRYRDDVRRFWRGDGAAGTLATRVAGSSDLFSGAATRSVNFLAAHDGFTLADTLAHAHRHNHANGEHNRDGHADEIAWNHGTEGATDDPAIRASRDASARALLATLFASKGTPMLTAGDEFSRSQHGNNNAYAQDNATTWIDWTARDTDLEAFVIALSAFRRGTPLADPAWLAAADWRDLSDRPMTPERWADAQGFVLRLPMATETLVLRIDRPNARVTLSRATLLESRP